MNAALPATSPVSLGEATRVFARIGLLSFGGPAGQIALMHRVLVDERRWLDEARFLHALNYCMLLPGPEAMQLATYAGWLLHGVRGGLIAGLLFVLPGAVVITALSAIYLLVGDVPLVQGLLFGLKAAVLAVVLEALIKVSKRALKGFAMVALAIAAFIAIAFLKLPFPVIIIGAAAVRGRHAFGERQATRSEIEAGTLAPAPEWTQPNARRLVVTVAVWSAIWLLPLAALHLMLGGGHVFSAEGLFFSKMAAVTFGGAYAVLVLRRAAGRRHPSLAAARRDAGRARPCRNHARPVDPGAGLRRLPRRSAGIQGSTRWRAASPARW